MLTEVDIANPAKMRVLRTLSVDGEHVSSRLHDHTVRVVIASTPRALDVPIPAPADRVRGPTSAKKRKPLRARRAGWVPSPRCATAAPAASASARSSPATTSGARRGSPAPGC